jgi:diguanylate cyclase (GGDEF)-like protein
VTVSIGVAVMMPDDTMEKMDNPADLLKCADEALYKAKANGRNQVVIMGG